MNMAPFEEVTGTYHESIRISASYLHVHLKPHAVALFKPRTEPVDGYTTYKRVT
jgi:hypothetical protein